VRLAQCARRPENEASEPYLSDIRVPLKGFLLKNSYHFLHQKGVGRLYSSCKDCLSFAVVAAEFLWRLGPSDGGPAWEVGYVAGGSAVMIAGRLSWALRWPRPGAGLGL